MLLALALPLLSAAAVCALPAIGTLLGDVSMAVEAEGGRGKREPSRSLTFSGYMPYGGGGGGGGGMGAFASSGDLGGYFPQPQANQGQQPPAESAQPSPWGKPEAEGEAEESEEQPPARRGKKSKKKHQPKEHEEDDDEYERPSGGRGGGGNAAASFNAWFPIMLGMFPGGQGGWGGQGDSGRGGGSHGGWEGQGENGKGGGSQGGWGGQGENGKGGGSQGGWGGQGDSSRGGGGAHYPPASHTTVIANSVSNGRAGVAASHAVAYGGSRQQERQRHR